MKLLPTIFIELAISTLSFIPQEKTGKALFKENCASCHAPTKALTGPPFQKIRNDYGLNWTVNFINHFDSVIRARDNKALYIYYLYNKTMQITFTNLPRTDIIKILDYVDSFPYDSLKYKHRKLSDIERQKYIEDEDEKVKKQEEAFNIFWAQQQAYPDSNYHPEFHTSAYGSSVKNTKTDSTKRKLLKKKKPILP